MKKTKIFLSIVLSLIMILTVAPLNVFALSRQGIILTFDTDIHGMSVEDYEEFITIDYGEVEFYTKNGALPITVATLDGSEFDGKFEGGNTYEFSITFVPENNYFAPEVLSPYAVGITNPSIIIKKYSIHSTAFSADSVTVVVEVTIDEPTTLERIADFFLSIFDGIKSFFSNLFNFK